MAIDLEQFKSIFFEESNENLDDMEAGLLDLSEGGTDLDVVNKIFRGAHSIKGGGATFGFTVVASFTHVMEELLDEMRNEKREADPEVVNVLLESVDVLRILLTAYQDGEDPDTDQAEALQEKLEAIRDQGKEATPIAAEAEAEAEGASTADATATGWKLSFKPHEQMLCTGNDPALMLRELSALGESKVVIHDESIPAFAEMNPESCYLSWDIELIGDIEKDDILEIFEWVEDDCDLEVTPILAAVAPKPERRSEDRRSEERRGDNRRQGGRRGSEKRATPSSVSIRVDTDRIDAIIDLVGELVITQSMLGQLGEDFSMDKLERLRDGLEGLERNSRDLQESVMRMRMQPISFAFSRFPRMVHDLSQKLDKQIRLEQVGEDTEMDKTVREKINDPLVHLVRNSIDHGLEVPEDRIAAGKDEEGYVRLRAFHQGGNIIVEISDDGNGLDRNKILDKAIERGVVSEDEADLMSDEQAFMLLFDAGFSTADQVSDLSGRGVGLDVVRRNIEALGGRVDVASKLGEGSVFTIRLPLTLAVLDGQLLRLGNETYVMPLTSIIESLQMQPENISGVGSDAELYRLRDEYISVIRLADTFGRKSVLTSLEKALLIVVELDGKHYGFLVDDLLGQQQVVIKSLETNFKRIEGISGATILGDGTVALILDIKGIVELSSVGSSRKGANLKLVQA
ncbi:MAG: chemotaxis protein CheA [Mariprofundaceae bacterium]